MHDLFIIWAKNDIYCIYINFMTCYFCHFIIRYTVFETDYDHKIRSLMYVKTNAKAGLRYQEK